MVTTLGDIQGAQSPRGRRVQLNAYIKNPTASCMCRYTTLWNINVSKTSPEFQAKKIKIFFDLPNKADTVLSPAQNLQVITIHSYIYVLWASCARGWNL